MKTPSFSPSSRTVLTIVATGWLACTGILSTPRAQAQGTLSLISVNPVRDENGRPLDTSAYGQLWVGTAPDQLSPAGRVVRPVAPVPKWPTFALTPVQAVDPLPRPEMDFQIEGGRLLISWTHGRLQSSLGLAGPWHGVPDPSSSRERARSPLAIEPHDSQGFFRVAQ